MEDMLWIEDIVGCTLAPPFLINSRIDMVNFVNLHKVVTRRSAFSNPSKCMKWRWIGRKGRKCKVEKPIFTSGRGFGFTRDPYNRSLNQFLFQKKEHQRRRYLW